MRKGIVGFVLGLLAGAVAALLGKPMLEPHLPAVFAEPGTETVVVKKRLEPDRLLLTVKAADEAVLATFTQRLEEIDLLVNEGDAVILRLPGDEPFVKDPEILQVKPRAVGGADELYAPEPVPPPSPIVVPPPVVPPPATTYESSPLETPDDVESLPSDDVDPPALDVEPPPEEAGESEQTEQAEEDEPPPA